MIIAAHLSENRIVNGHFHKIDILPNRYDSISDAPIEYSVYVSNNDPILKLIQGTRIDKLIIESDAIKLTSEDVYISYIKPCQLMIVEDSFLGYFNVIADKSFVEIK